MSVKTFIIDALTGAKARVTKDGALVTAPQTPAALPTGTPNPHQYLFGRLGVDGLDDGAVNQNVDGSVTPQKFKVVAHPDYDIHIMQITVVLADSAVAHSAFGNVSALATGWDLKLTETGIETFLFEKAKTGGELIIQSGFGRAYGDGAASFELTNYSATADAQTITVPVGEFIPNGLRIGRGTTDKLEAIVNDDLTGLDVMNVFIYGFKNIPSE